MAYASSIMPTGSKLWLLDLGILHCDASGLLSGTNVFNPRLPPQPHERRYLIMISGLIHYPGVGLILFDVGSCEDVIKNWTREIIECTPRTWEKSINGLPEAIKAIGAGEIKDVKAVVLSHLHMDHAGGLEHFFDTDVEIWCHESELKNAFWANVLRLKWRTISEPSYEIWQGVTLHRCPGHTEGSIVMELTLEIQGTVLLTGDLFHIKENYEIRIPHGSLMRDFNGWHRSRECVRHLAKKKNAKVLLGHEPSYYYSFNVSPGFTE
ncbi:metallo-beta-lactamase superfamily protein [Xylogone sp. PMI_703]|nr:metallo-beta-lactamase superfamily protein [Xylogone sp. PMI_703]